MANTTARELAAAAENVAKNHKTLYVKGAFGAPLTARNKAHYTRSHMQNQRADRRAKIMEAGTGTFAFSSEGLILGLLWGWKGDKGKPNGGASYATHGVPDMTGDQMLQACQDVSGDFRTIQVGELLHAAGHVGIYIGGGLAVESTNLWQDGVQITAVHNIHVQPGYTGRTWEKHARLPWVTYEAEI